MKAYKGYLIDLDGTMYRGKAEIKEAKHFIERLNEKGIPYLFVTNNSSRTPQQVADKLRSFHIPASSDQIFTTSLATASYVAERKEAASVYVIGEEGLRSALESKGLQLVEDEHPDFVITGIDRDITYEKLATACLAIRNGASFVSTNGDVVIPTERGLLPGNGALTALVAVSTETEPVFIGKPEAIIMEQALQVLGTVKEETLMVGDNYKTDILAGIRAGMDTLLVHTGVTQKEHLKQVDEQPTYTRDTLDDWEII
ncbi:TIGR01457 family HAD-type hydrolase [Bacillus thermotolerans]|uniref:TIGR01457 family HAD-type hydrolase n=1 Tax=Bacillus thermotolerans TaxID=1221996 RepID=UPI0005892F57|nr:TIGR01457 family HAD-type hydrolase [Bacillus thermotolerans]KKB44425.1 putative NagD-like phosphatase [Bacillus thermotolerans]